MAFAMRWGRKTIKLQHQHQRWLSSASPVISHEIVSSTGEAAADQQPRTAVLIHGLMGAGKNLRSLAKGLLGTVTERIPPGSPGWQLVLVDLRNHGNSASLEHLKPPHNIESAAKDIAHLVESKLLQWPDVVVGHSLGGKVAMEFAQNCAHERYGSGAVVPKQVWVLDVIPGKVNSEQKGEVEHVIEYIQTLPNPIPSRRWFVEQTVKEGFSKSLADWLASNLRGVNGSSEQMVWVFDVKGIYDMFLSYKRNCYWSLLDSPPKGMDVGVVRAENSDRWFPDSISRMEKLAQSHREPKSDKGTVSYQVLRKAGHWAHVDNPNGLIEILAPSFVKITAL